VGKNTNVRKSVLTSRRKVNKVGKGGRSEVYELRTRDPRKNVLQGCTNSGRKKCDAFRVKTKLEPPKAPNAHTHGNPSKPSAGTSLGGETKNLRWKKKGTQARAPKQHKRKVTGQGEKEITHPLRQKSKGKQKKR